MFREKPQRSSKKRGPLDWMFPDKEKVFRNLEEHYERSLWKAANERRSKQGKPLLRRTDLGYYLDLEKSPPVVVTFEGVVRNLVTTEGALEKASQGFARLFPAGLEKLMLSHFSPYFATHIKRGETNYIGVIGAMGNFLLYEIKDGGLAAAYEWNYMLDEVPFLTLSGKLSNTLTFSLEALRLVKIQYKDFEVIFERLKDNISFRITTSRGQRETKGPVLLFPPTTQ
ncbi:MAG: hypothetical protein GXN92_02180 [Candidatus Micrarchaeota archaeon]|nr:hypothetical protein [Candidatus Micrarchaeota archaeon]